MYEHQITEGNIAWTNVFSEAGGSFLIVNVTCGAIPKFEPYWNGASWISAAIHGVPFLQGFAFKKGYLKHSPSYWLDWTFFGKDARS